MSSTVSKRDLLLGLLVILGWAGNTVVIKFITIELEPFTGLTIRLAIGSLVFLPFLRWTGEKTFFQLAQIVFFMSVLHWGSLIWAIDKLGASMSAIIMQIQVIFAILVGRFFFAETFGWRTWAGIAIGITGVIVLVGLPETPPPIEGVLAMVFSMMTIVIAYARMKTLEGVSSVNYVGHMHIIALLPIAGTALLLENPMEVDWSALNKTTLIPAFAYQIIIVSGVHMLWQRLMARNAMSGLPNLTLLLPIFGVILAFIFLGESLSPAMLFGGLLTTCGVGIVMIRKQKRITG